jgi:hypothetical protein
LRKAQRVLRASGSCMPITKMQRGWIGMLGGIYDKGDLVEHVAATN